MALIKYSASNIKGHQGKEILVDEDFVPYLNKMNAVAVRHGFIVYVTSSFRKDGSLVKGAIVEPAKKGNHLAGHALDVNLYHIASKTWYNSTKMGDGTGLDELFIVDVEKETGLRFGGRFNDKDEVHFDSGLNLNNPKLYQTKYKAYQDGMV